VRLKWAILALGSGQVRPRLAASYRNKWHQGICNPLRGGNAARFGDDGAREGGGGESRSLQPSVCLPFYFFVLGTCPVPDSPTDWGEPIALSLIVNSPLCSDVPVGVNITETLQLWPGASVSLHSDVTANTGGDAVSLSILTARPVFFLPAFLIVTVLGLLVVPTVTVFPNDSEVKRKSESACDFGRDEAMHGAAHRAESVKALAAIQSVAAQDRQAGRDDLVAGCFEGGCQGRTERVVSNSLTLKPTYPETA